MDPAALRELFSVARAGAEFPAGDSRFMGADLRGALLLRANLSGGNFSGARFDRASLSGARFVAADLSETALVGVDLNGADLTGAELISADLTEARIEGACFANADLSGACLKNTGGRPASVAGMKIDHETFRRSEMTEAAVIELWRGGASIDDLEKFPERVQHACHATTVEADDEVPQARDVALAEARHRSALLPSLAPKSAIGSRIDTALSLRPSISAPVQRPASVGDSILGVRLAELVGHGPHGTVWKAHDADGRRCAVKIFDPGPEASPGAAATFKRGVQTLNRAVLLDERENVSLPRVYSVAVNELAFSYDYYDNGSAAGIPALRWEIERTQEFFDGICRAVAALHEMGLTHRSLKPSNVLVDDELRPVLADPGMLGLRDPNQPLSTVEAIYRAPEELGGESTQSPTADIYGLGRLLWFLLQGSDPDEPYEAFATLSALEGAPPGLVRIVRKATAHDPAARYQWVEELLTDLARHHEHERVGIGATGSDHEPPRQMISLLPVPMPRRPVQPRSAVPVTAKWRPLERAGGFMGLGVVLVASIAVFATSAPSPEAAELFGIATTIGLALATLLLKPYAERPVLWRLILFGVAIVILVPLELENLVILRWKYTLENGNDDARPRVARFLSRRGARDLRGARLARSDLRRADLGRTDLRMANLSGAKMIGANLSEADLAGADISGADLSGADLALSTVAQAKGWLQTSCSRTTSMPQSFRCVDGRPSGTPQ
jgi:uncharacterized protein YjbI with pentapeptide repeats